MAATKDLTNGKPLNLILGFGAPLLLGFLFQQFYNIADTAIVGRFLGSDALAAVGSTGSISFLILGFVIGICNGFAIPIARMVGADDWKQLRKYVTSSLILCVFFAIVITTLTLIFCTDILTVMKTPDDIFDRAHSYIFTIFAGIPGYFLYNMCAGILRSMGNSKTPVNWLITASAVNIVLDIVFIVVFKLDVFGAAIATVIAQFTSGFGCLFKICRDYDILKADKDDWRFSIRHIRYLCAMGLPMGLQFSITAIGSVILQTSVNLLGTSYVSAITAGNKLSAVMCCPFEAMGSTMATYASQNVGANKYDRLNKGVATCTIIAAVYSLAAFLVLFLFGDNLASLFLDKESRDLLPLVQQFLTTLSAFYFILSLIHIFRMSIQGMGFSPIATFAGILEMIARGIFAYLVGIYGFKAACFASPAAWIFADMFLIPAYFVCRKRLMKKHKAT